jgi:hypothetical protein
MSSHKILPWLRAASAAFFSVTLRSKITVNETGAADRAPKTGLNALSRIPGKLPCSVSFLATPGVIELHPGHLPLAVIVIGCAVASADRPNVPRAFGWNLDAHAFEVGSFALACRELAKLIGTAGKGQNSAAALPLRGSRYSA